MLQSINNMYKFKLSNINHIIIMVIIVVSLSNDQYV